jgi:hypothetical protein
MITQFLATQSARCVPAGTWICPSSNASRDDAIVALAKRGVVLLGEPNTGGCHAPRLA